MLKTQAALGVALAIFAGSAAASEPIDCRIRTMPPAKFASGPLPAHSVVSLPMIDLQRLYARKAGRSFNAALSYCKRGPIGFVDPTTSPPTIYLPADATPTCVAQVLHHEQAHVRGWGHDHAGGTTQQGGPCRG